MDTGCVPSVVGLGSQGQYGELLERNAALFDGVGGTFVSGEAACGDGSRCLVEEGRRSDCERRGAE